MSIITKNALVLRDLDILGPMATENLVHVNSWGTEELVKSAAGA